jgi:hypothetical protein
MTKTIGVAAEDDLMMTLVNQAAQDFDAEVIPAAPARDCYKWAGYDALIYDEDQLGGDTVPIIEEMESFLVSREDVAGWELNGTVEQIRRFLVQVLN